MGGTLFGGDGTQSGYISSAHDLGPLVVRGGIRGGANQDSGEVTSGGKLGNVTLGGPLIGGAADRSGSIRSNGDMGAVVVHGDVQGGAAADSGEINSGGKISGVVNGLLTGVRIVGSLIGGGDATHFLSGSIVASSLGPVTITGDLRGGPGEASGDIDTRAVASVTIGGSIVGGSGEHSANIFVNGPAGPMKIGGDVRGGEGPESAEIFVEETLASVMVGGSVLGGAGLGSGFIGAVTGIGPVKIHGDLAGGAAELSGVLELVGVTIGAAKLTSLTVGGSVRSGGGASSGAVLVNGTIGPILVKGSLIGLTTPVVIAASGPAMPTGTTDLAIARLTVKRRVEGANILAGYDRNGSPVNADAQTGPVTVGGDWIASNLVAGIQAGTDGLFGTNDDQLIAGGSPSVIARIASVKIGGQAIGTVSNTGDHFGFVAQLVASLSIGGAEIPLTAGADSVNIGVTGDLTLLET